LATSAKNLLHNRHCHSLQISKGNTMK
jgi:hypothetical protein